MRTRERITSSHSLASHIYIGGQIGIEGGGERTVVLFALVLVHCSQGGRHSEKGVLRASPIENVSDEGTLAKVGGQYGYLFGGVAEKTHILVYGHCVFRFSEVLDEVWRGLIFSLAFVVLDVDELEFVAETVYRQVSKQATRRKPLGYPATTYPAFAVWYSACDSNRGRFPSSR